MLEKPLEQITLVDLEDLVREGIPEGKTIDYKRDTYGRTDSEKKELLKDTSSFANTIGGDLIIGMAEANGVPTAIPGVPSVDVDAEKLRLDETIRRGIEPRIDFAIHAVETGSGTVVFIIRIRESWILPHRVVYQGKFGEFWARNSAGKYSMDTTELRRAFTLSETLYDKVRSFSQERLVEIGRGRTPIPLKDRARLVFHMIPLESFRSRIALRIHDVMAFAQKFPPIGSQHIGGYRPRLNFDGIVLYSGGNRESDVSTYTQLYRNGMVEAVTDNISYEEDGKTLLAPNWYEASLIHELGLYLKSYKALSVSPPIWCFMTLTGVNGASVQYPGWYRHTPHSIDRPDLAVPEFVVDDLDASPIDVLRPAFDLIWNALGLPCSFNFDKDGKWKPV